MPGKEIDENYIYEFVFTNNIKNITICDENFFPACLTNNIYVMNTNITTYKIKTKIKFDLIQNNCCFSFNHSKAGIVAVAWQNIDDLSEYPEDGRLVFMFNESFDDVERKLAMKNILMLN